MREILSNIKKITPYLMIAIGCILIALAAYQRLSTIYYQNQLVKNYDNYMEELSLEDLVKQHNKEVILNNEIQLPETLVNPLDEKNNSDKDIKIETPEIIGILEIPKINVNVAILEGTDDRALKYTVGYYPQTAKPGENGNMVLLGHRNYVYGRFFNKLDKLEEGDMVIVKRNKYTYTYKVTESFVVEPKDTWVLNSTSEPQITMITCTPIGTYTHRLIVKGILESTNTIE